MRHAERGRKAACTTASRDLQAAGNPTHRRRCRNTPTPVWHRHRDRRCAPSLSRPQVHAQLAHQERMMRSSFPVSSGNVTSARDTFAPQFHTISFSMGTACRVSARSVGHQCAALQPRMRQTSLRISRPKTSICGMTRTWSPFPPAVGRTVFSHADGIVRENVNVRQFR